MPSVFRSFAALVGTKLDELPGGIFKSRCEIRTIGAAIDQLTHDQTRFLVYGMGLVRVSSTTCILSGGVWSSASWLSLL